MRAAAGALALALTAACFFPLFAPPVSAEITESAAPGYGVGRIMPEAEGAEEEPEEEKLIFLRPAVHDAGCTVYDAEIEAIARTMWGEARGVGSKTEIAAVGWCILNRVDSPDFPDNVIEVCAQKNQFKGYRPSYPVTDELRGLAADVIVRWVKEREGAEDVGRVLPREYLYFVGDGEHNLFTAEFLGTDVWSWDLPSPYED